MCDQEEILEQHESTWRELQRKHERLARYSRDLDGLLDMARELVGEVTPLKGGDAAELLAETAGAFHVADRHAGDYLDGCPHPLCRRAASAARAGEDPRGSGSPLIFAARPAAY